MSEKIQHQETFESLPTEESVFDAVKEICGDRAFSEISRSVREGKLAEVDIHLNELDENGRQVQVSYTVNKKGEATIDVTYYDPGKGFDYRPGMGYDPRDIVDGGVLGRFINGVWQSEQKL